MADRDELLLTRKYSTEERTDEEELNLTDPLPSMLLTPTELLREQPVDAWFCLRAQPKREHIAAACLRQTCEAEVFCPRVRFRKQTNRGPVWFVESMFPGYLFSRFDYTAIHRRIRQSPAISGFVQFGEGLALLPDTLVAEIKRCIDNDEILTVDPSLKPGQNVQIVQGPFRGLEALVSRLITPKERVEILIEWMGRTIHVEAGTEDLLPLTNHVPRSHL
jgi:transcriptional antiterminator RfaH